MIIHARNFVTSDDALGGSVIEKSLRFNRSDNAKLSKAFSSAGNRKKWTWSGWVKFPNPEDSNTTQIFSYNQGNTNNRGSFYKGSSGVLNYQLRVGGSSSSNKLAFVTTDAQLRDPSAWYHIVLVIDSDQGSSSDRVKFYINGDLQSVVYHNGPSSGFSTWINSTETLYIGAAADENGGNIYLAEINFIDGQALDASYFGYTDFQTKIWKPKRYEGTYGTNGFHLEFKDNSSVSALGKDTSGNGNDWTVSNFSVSAGAGNDSLEDTPTNNFCTLNPLTSNLGGGSGTVSNGNLAYVGTGSYDNIVATFAVSTGKWYYEAIVTQFIGNNIVGWTTTDEISSNYTENQLIWNNSVGLRKSDRTINWNTNVTTGLSFSNDDVIGFALDLTAYELKVYQNNTLRSTITLPTDKGNTWIPCLGDNSTADPSYTINFGQRPFSYTPPSGFKALSTKNLPPNVPSIIRPQKHFETLLYTGNNNTSQNITGLEFQPDLVWVKNRDNVERHHLVDSVRGNNKVLFSNEADGERTGSHGAGHTQLNLAPNGFNLVSNGSNDELNFGTRTYVAWCWKAGGAAVSNNDGAIASSVSVNTKAGFSIVGFQPTAQGTAVTVGHGLGATPDWILVKSRGSSANWDVFHSSLGSSKKLYLNSNGDQIDSGAWGSTDPTSSVFTFNPGNQHNNNHIAYCWTAIPGYSKFGSYTGNGSSDGTYVHLGFRPAWIMTKRADGGSQNWLIHDIKRDPHNVANKKLAPNLSYEENNSSYIGNSTNDIIDILSNGFKMRSGNNHTNINGGTFIYMAFAEQPGTTPFETFPNAR